MATPAKRQKRPALRDYLDTLPRDLVLYIARFVCWPPRWLKRQLTHKDLPQPLIVQAGWARPYGSIKWNKSLTLQEAPICGLCFNYPHPALVKRLISPCGQHGPEFDISWIGNGLYTLPKHRKKHGKQFFRIAFAKGYDCDYGKQCPYGIDCDREH